MERHLKIQRWILSNVALGHFITAVCDGSQELPHAILKRHQKARATEYVNSQCADMKLSVFEFQPLKGLLVQVGCETIA